MNKFLTMLSRSALLFCAAIVGLLLIMTLGAFKQGAVPFWIGGEASMPLGIGGIALLLGCIPSYLLAARLVVRIAQVAQVDNWHVLVVGFFQGISLLYALVYVGVVTARIVSEMGIRFPGLWEVAFILTNFALGVLISCVVPAVILAVILRMSRT